MHGGKGNAAIMQRKNIGRTLKSGDEIKSSR